MSAQARARRSCSATAAGALSSTSSRGVCHPRSREAGPAALRAPAARGASGDQEARAPLPGVLAGTALGVTGRLIVLPQGRSWSSGPAVGRAGVTSPWVSAGSGTRVLTKPFYFETPRRT